MECVRCFDVLTSH